MVSKLKNVRWRTADVSQAHTDWEVVESVESDGANKNDHIDFTFPITNRPALLVH